MRGERKEVNYSRRPGRGKDDSFWVGPRGPELGRMVGKKGDGARARLRLCVKAVQYAAYGSDQLRCLGGED